MNNNTIQLSSYITDSKLLEERIDVIANDSIFETALIIEHDGTCDHVLIGKLIKYAKNYDLETIIKKVA